MPKAKSSENVDRGNAPVTGLLRVAPVRSAAAIASQVVKNLKFGRRVEVQTGDYNRAVDLTIAISEVARQDTLGLLFPCQIVIAETLSLADGAFIVRVLPPWAGTADEAVQKCRVLIRVESHSTSLPKQEINHEQIIHDI